MELWVYPKGPASELLDGTLKLRHCTSIFSTFLLSWSLLGVGHGSEKRHSVTPVHLLDDGSNLDRRVRLTRKTRPVTGFP